MLNREKSSLLVSFQPGELIFSSGEEGQQAYIIESGQVEIFVTTDNTDVSFKTLSAGDVFGEMAVIDASPRSASARALTETCCVVVSSKQISDRIKDSDPVVKLLVSTLLNHIRSLTNGVSQSSHPSASSLSQVIPASTALTVSSHQPVLDKIRLESELLEAISTDAFIPYYQPFVNIETEDILGFEFLIRWHSPTRGWVSPGVFINTAEETSLIRPIGRWVLEQACADLNRFNQSLKAVSAELTATRPPIFISVNVSGRQFQAPQFLDELLEIVHRHNIPCEQIKLEVTERVLMEGKAIDVIQQCREQGFHISLDDFGTGFSSLTYLAQFEIDSLKIDQYFVREMMTHQRTHVLIKNILGMTQDLNMLSFAEGVETQQQLDILRKLGCQIGQGYLFSKPVPFEDATQVLLENYRRPSGSSLWSTEMEPSGYQPGLLG